MVDIFVYFGERWGKYLNVVWGVEMFVDLRQNFGYLFFVGGVIEDGKGLGVELDVIFGVFFDIKGDVVVSDIMSKLVVVLQVFVGCFVVCCGICLVVLGKVGFVFVFVNVGLEVCGKGCC